MKRLFNPKIIYPLIAVLLGITFFLLYQEQAEIVKVSQFGKYQGYTQATYNGSKRISEYLTLSDGTKLAYDLILPANKGVAAEKPLPVLFKYTPYLRSFTIFDENGKNIIKGLYPYMGWKEEAMLRFRYWIYDRGHLMDPLFRTKWLETMVKHGYAVIVVEKPGTGASMGVSNPGMEITAQEANEILDWIAAQIWCDGNIGMYGESQQAWYQFAAASTGNPHLKAIFPAASEIELYDSIEYPGGVYNKTFTSMYSWMVTFLETVTTPVDSDQDRSLLAQARQERGSQIAGSVTAYVEQSPFRDSLLPSGKNVWKGMALYPYIDRVNRSGIPVYMSVGWYDVFTADMFYWHHNLTVPKRLTVRPLDHSGADSTQFDLNYDAEALRWFDYWLKGIDNGIMHEPPIHYYVMGAPKKESWQTSSVWPLEKQKLTPFYFGQGKTGSAASVNDGSLSSDSPAASDASDAYTVDYTTTTGKRSRWGAIDLASNYPDMRSNDAKALTYTTAPLEAEMEITGPSIAHLWLTTNAPDLDTFVYLEKVARNGKSTYITEGVLRATHRKLSQAPFNNMGLPYHSHYKSDLEPIKPGEPFELVFNVLPTSSRFHKGDRIRITIAFSDADSFETPIITPAPQLHLLRDKDHPSLVELPVIQAK